MKHPLEELADEFDRCADRSFRNPSAANAFMSAARQLRQTLASLWHPFDPDDERTWPTKAGKRWLVVASTLKSVAWFQPEHGCWFRVGDNEAMHNVTDYAELLPGPKR